MSEKQEEASDFPALQPCGICFRTTYVYKGCRNSVPVLVALLSSIVELEKHFVPIRKTEFTRNHRRVFWLLLKVNPSVIQPLAFL